jgi:hypothetical protein
MSRIFFRSFRKSPLLRKRILSYFEEADDTATHRVHKQRILNNPSLRREASTPRRRPLTPSEQQARCATSFRRIHRRALGIYIPRTLRSTREITVARHRRKSESLGTAHPIFVALDSTPCKIQPNPLSPQRSYVAVAYSRYVYFPYLFGVFLKKTRKL